jgi:hypothetical protein
MFITKKALNRRTILRGMGATLALPLLDSMIPALSALSKTAGKPIMRFGAVYVPMGIIMENWTPKITGNGFEITPILQPLSAFRDRLTLLSGLDSVGSGHPNATVAFLTDVRGAQGANIHAGVSVDQFLASKIGQDNKLPSLEVGIESLALVGDCENTNCGYLNTLSYSSATTPLPVETNPREVFERLFGDADSGDPAARLARIQQKRSLLDSLTHDVAALDRRLGSGDRGKMNEYLQAVREVERRIQKAESENAETPATMEAPEGAPVLYADHVKLMFDLQLLAYQSDSTRVSTFMMSRESSNRRYPEAGVPEPHHSTTHHLDVQTRMTNVTKINTYHTALFASYLDKLANTPDGDGSLLDHMIILYGSGLSDGNLHYGINLPLILAGGGAGTLKGGRHLQYSSEPLANLHLTLMDKYGVEVEQMGNSTGRVEGLSGV